MFDYKKLKKYNGRKAVSPVVATLILIIVAIVGAVAVGLIVSGIGSSTSKNANANNAASNAQNIIYVGGSTTVFPVTSAGLPAFEQQTGISVQLSQGGSDAGMQGILSGALDVGESSSLTVNPVATLIGGSGVVFVTTSECGAFVAPVYTLAAITTAATCAGTGTSNAAAPLFDNAGTPSACLEISRDALAQMYLDGTFYLSATACTTNKNQLLDPAQISTTTGAGPYKAVQRSDPGGTQDTACGYLNGAPVGGASTLAYSTGQEGCGAAPIGGTGNLGVLQAVQGCPSADKGCIGFVDLGFADGASSQAASTCSGTGTTPCKVFISEVTSGNGIGTGEAAADGPEDCATGTASAYTKDTTCYVLAGENVANLHTFIKDALKYGATENPATLTFPSTTGAAFFPDSTATALGSAGALDRLLFLVTNGNTAGTPTGRFVTFFTQPSAEQYFLGAGYESQFDITAV